MHPSLETESNTTRLVGLSCLRCGHQQLRVVYTRPAPDGKVVRRRECRQCGARVTTWERAIG
jgi:transcriptional regulator NrdR family protein